MKQNGLLNFLNIISKHIIPFIYKKYSYKTRYFLHDPYDPQNEYEPKQLKMSLRLYSNAILKEYVAGSYLEMVTLEYALPINLILIKTATDHEKKVSMLRQEQFFNQYKCDWFASKQNAYNVTLGYVSPSTFYLLHDKVTGILDTTDIKGLAKDNNYTLPTNNESDLSNIQNVNYCFRIMKKLQQNDRWRRVTPDSKGYTKDVLENEHVVGPMFPPKMLFKVLKDPQYVVPLLRIMDPYKFLADKDFVKPCVDMRFRSFMGLRSKSWINTDISYDLTKILNEQSTNTDFLLIDSLWFNLINFDRMNERKMYQSRFVKVLNEARLKRYIVIQVFQVVHFFTVLVDRRDSILNKKWTIYIADSTDVEGQSLEKNVDICRNFGIPQFLQSIHLLSDEMSWACDDTAQEQHNSVDCGVECMRRFFSMLLQMS